MVLLGELTAESASTVADILREVGFAASRIAIGFVPIVGPALDLCEAATGREFCRPSGRELSVTERVLAGIGVVPGVAKFWTGVATKGAGTSATMAVAGRLRRFGHLEDLAKAEQKLLYKRLGHVATLIDDVPGAEIKRLSNSLSDAVVLQVGAQLKGRGLRELESMEFFLARLNQQVQTAARTRGSAVKTLPRLAGKSATETKGLLRQRGFQLVSSTDVQEAWVHSDGSVVRIASGYPARPYLHFKKEINFSGGYLDEHIACKLTDAGAPVPQGQNEAGELLAQWYRERTGTLPDRAKDSQLDQLKRVWGDQTHISCHGRTFSSRLREATSPSRR